MRLIKGFILALAGLFTVITLFSLLIPSQVLTVRSIIIQAGGEQVFASINDLEKWKHWHPVFMQDSAAIKISNPSSGINAYAEWSVNGKKNKLQIREVFYNRLNASLLRPGEKDVDNIIAVTALPGSNNVQVEWRVLTKLKWYPWEKFSGIFIDRMTGPGYEAALNNLKNLMENKQLR